MDLAVIAFPDIDPVIYEFGPYFGLGPFAVRWYALAYIAGVLFAMWYMKLLVSTPRIWAGGEPAATPEQIDSMFFWALGGVILGGRVGYLIFYGWEKVAADPLYILRTWEGGMSFHGGFFGVILMTFLYAKRQGLRLDRLLDLGAASTAVGLGLGRLANFINGELFGRATDAPWGVIFPNGGPDPRHPTQLYEFLLEGVVLFAVINWAIFRFKILARPGLAAGLYSLIYGVSRVLIETVREPDEQLGYFGGSFTMGMILSLPMLVIGAWLILRSRRVA